MHTIIALWAVPRSTSTAFEWMMRQRGDLDCLHEPYGEAWYQGEAPLWPRLTPDSKRTPGLTLESVHADLMARAEKGPVFIKDFPHYVDHLWDDGFLQGCEDLFTHAFLIRDPAKTITSMYDKWPDFNEAEVGFPEQRRLYDRLIGRYGIAPPVIDSDDLLENPHGMIKKFCDAVGIPFLPEALTWEPGARDEVSWWDSGAFHANLRNSDGLKPQPRTGYVDLQAAPQRVQDVCERMQPHYAHLHTARLR